MVRNKNVLFCFGACTANPEKLLIITEWVTNGTLRDLLDNKTIELTWTMRLSLAAQIAKGIGFIHSMHLIHCDIKR
jgi:serine/threonine protein kinase